MNQDILNLAERVLSQPVIDVSDLKKGLTNRNYLVKTAHHTVVIRVPYADQSQIVHRHHEAQALKLIEHSNLDFETLYFDEASGIKITRYVDDFITFDETTQLDRIVRTAHLMKRLHQINQTIGYLFDPIERYLKYRSHTQDSLISDEEAKLVLDRMSHHTPRLTLCHNDWVPGNIGFTSTKDYLIDYEYAGDNDPFFDVMSFITENTLSAQEEAEFLDAYFDEPLTQDERDRLTLYRDVHNLLWCTWAKMMHESRLDPVYLEIAYDKLKAFKQSTSK